MKLAAVVVAVMVAGAQTSSQVELAKTELRGLMTELNAALAAHDRAALERIYADEFLYIHALGGPVDKASQVASALASTGQLPMPSFDGLMVFGETAILRTPVDGRFGTTIYVKRSGRWQILQLQGTPIPSTRTAAAVPAEVLRGYAGRYEQDNGLFVTIAVEPDHLTLQVDGRQKFDLLSDSNTQFSLPGGAGQFTFEKTADGGMSYVLHRSNGAIVKGVRHP